MISSKFLILWYEAHYKTKMHIQDYTYIFMWCCFGCNEKLPLADQSISFSENVLCLFLRSTRSILNVLLHDIECTSEWVKFIQKMFCQNTKPFNIQINTCSLAKKLIFNNENRFFCKNVNLICINMVPLKFN